VKIRLDLEGAAELSNTLLTAQRKFKGDKSEVLTRIAKRFADSIRDNIRAGGFAPLSPVTLKIRQQRGGSGSAPLIDSGDLLDSIGIFVTDREAAAGSAKSRAGWLQLGITTAEDSMIPGKIVPPRPFILISEADGDWALEELADSLFEERRAA